MDWKFKALGHLIFSYIPFGTFIHYCFQRYITKTLPRNEASFMKSVTLGKKHIEAFQRYSNQSLGNAVFFEFGAGWDLLHQLVFYAFGIEHQIVIDIHKLIRRELINDTIMKFHKVEQNHLMRMPEKLIRSEMAKDLKIHYGIEYRAPCDVRKTGLSDSVIDCITSTSTIEHIPYDDIKAILFECRRILKSCGLLSIVIDYQDHYSEVDKKISVYNFLQYSGRIWAIFNPISHYQNRLRHRDYITLFKKTGFDVLEENIIEGTPDDLEILSQLSLDKRFKNYYLSELAVRSAHIILRKR